MPVRFLTEEQRQRYGRYADEPTLVQLARYFHLDDVDRALILARRGDHNRLGFALQLGTVRFLGTFLSNPTDVPSGVIAYVAQQLQIKDMSCLCHYLERPPTHREHAGQIRQKYGYQDFTDQPESWRFVRWLYGRAWVGTEAPSVLFDLSTVYLVERKILLPGVTVLERMVANVRERAAQRAWKLLSRLPNAQQRQQLETLLIVDPVTQQPTLDRLKSSSTRYSAPALVEALYRVEEIRQFNIRSLNVTKVPMSRLQTLSRTAVTVRIQTLVRMAMERRIATLLAFVYDIEITAQDDAIDILELLVKDLLAKSKRDGKKKRLRTLKDLDAAALQLSDACRITLDPECPDQQVRSETFKRVSEEQLAASAARVEELARPPEDRYYPEILARWRTVRLFLPQLLKTIQFQTTKSGHVLLKAIQFLQSIEGQIKPDLRQAPLNIVTKGWHRWVCLPNGEIDRRAYTFCVLEQLVEGLRRRDLYVSPSIRWSNPQAKLLQGQAWESSRSQVCRTLSLDVNPAVELENLSKQLSEAYERTSKNLPDNPAVIIETQKGRDSLTISPLEKLEEPLSLVLLRHQVAELLPRVDLPEVLLEIHGRTGFLDEFTHANEMGSRTADLLISLCAVLVATACNIGFTPLQQRDVPALRRHRLDWVRQHYLRHQTIAAANARLVDAQSQIPLAQLWGGGEVASADGLRFVVPVKTLNAGANSKYFGQGRGITYYNFTSDQFTGFHGVVVPGTLRDSLVVLVGLLEQQTSLQPRELMTDSSGYSDIVFGLFWLLGYQFSPRLADAGEARFWRLDGEADYGVLDGLARQRVRTALVQENWDDMLRVAGSLKLGTVSALEIMRVLQRGGKPLALGKAVGELGRIAKTLYLLNYVDDESYRRRILTQLNRGEGRHSLARAVCHGQKGEIHQCYRQGQENQLNTLGLVVNVIVLWNTLYMEMALNYLRQQKAEVKLEDLPRLSPLGHFHINMLGRYHFELPEILSRGGVRPLRDPNDLYEQDD